MSVKEKLEHKEDKKGVKLKRFITEISTIFTSAIHFILGKKKKKDGVNLMYLYL